MSTFTESVWQDARYALRDVYRRPGFALAVVLTLALGIGANSAIFSVIQAVLLRPPPFDHSDRLVLIYQTNRDLGFQSVPVSPADFLEWRERTHSFDSMVAWRNWYYTLVESGRGATDRIETVKGVRASPRLFAMLGVQPALGRTFRPDEEQPGLDHVVVLSYATWQVWFGADPGIVGRPVLVDGQPFLVIGVLPRQFQFLQPDFAIWMPLTVDADMHDWTGHSINVYARLSNGVSVAQAQGEMNSIAGSLEQTYPESNRGWGARVTPVYPTRTMQELRPALEVLFAAAGCVLLIACANVASMVMARAVGRHRDMAIRVTLGATRLRLIRQLLIESLVLAGLGGAAGLLLAQWGLRMLIAWLPPSPAYQALEATLDLRTLGFTLAAAIGSAIFIGLVPGLQATRVDPVRVSTSPPSRVRVRQILVGAELAMSILLLIGAGLLLKSFWRLQAVDPGFDVERVLSLQVWLPKARYPDPSSIREFYRQVLARVERAPGVRAAGAVSFRPFLGWAGVIGVDVDVPRNKRPTDVDYVSYRVVTPNYLRFLGQRLVRGRDLAEHDGAESVGVAVVNDALARRLYPNQDPIGKHIRPAFRAGAIPWEPDSTTRWLEIVGVAADVNDSLLVDPITPVLYVSYLQHPSSLMFLLVRTQIEPESVLGVVQREMHAVDPAQPIANVTTIERALSDAVGQPRFNAQLVGVFAALALVLSVVGVYAVVSYLVTQRRLEIGVRMALGARSNDIVPMVLRDTLTFTASGIAIGLIGAVAAMRALASSLYGVSPTDTVIFTMTPILLLAVTLVASYIPARRAAAIDPALTLRE